MQMLLLFCYAAQNIIATTSEKHNFVLQQQHRFFFFRVDSLARSEKLSLLEVACKFVLLPTALLSFRGFWFCNLEKIHALLTLR
jgi:hypothetical protein